MKGIFPIEAVPPSWPPGTPLERRTAVGLSEGGRKWPKGGVLVRHRCVSDVICGCHGDAIDWPTRRQTSRESRRHSDYCLPPAPLHPPLFHPDSPCFALRSTHYIPRAFTSPLACYTEPCSTRSAAYKRIRTHGNPLYTRPSN